EVDAGAVVADGHEQAARAIDLGGEAQPADLGLARRGAPVGALEPVIDGVPDRMDEAGHERAQRVAADADAVGLDVDLDLLAELRREPARVAGELLQRVAQGLELPALDEAQDLAVVGAVAEPVDELPVVAVVDVYAAAGVLDVLLDAAQAVAPRGRERVEGARSDGAVAVELVLERVGPLGHRREAEDEAVALDGVQRARHRLRVAAGAGGLDQALDLLDGALEAAAVVEHVGHDLLLLAGRALGAQRLDPVGHVADDEQDGVERAVLMDRAQVELEHAPLPLEPPRQLIDRDLEGQDVLRELLEAAGEHG